MQCIAVYYTSYSTEANERGHPPQRNRLTVKNTEVVDLDSVKVYRAISETAFEVLLRVKQLTMRLEIVIRYRSMKIIMDTRLIL